MRWPPDEKHITPDLSVSVTEHGWPHWTTIRLRQDSIGLRPEHARDLHYALGRIVAFLDAIDADERRRHQ